ncbi:type IV pilus twitching motility protein PilT [Candidatus Methylacidithermus pantelleriae]|uniref:Twitching motility protein PilT n=1 Tax=Candidatus Methylacidithermus pantelleriae TaxID=2744239 RepID=A0A8J2FMU7_9BACT|nr:ATPase, T2SS/T4P/T4SS family [Candidatus Methylacidithermus pantelleriae]CAF0689837.1 Twitching motility protein PilT [Candidatus Methylacidithermus pantelleriae]
MKDFFSLLEAAVAGGALDLYLFEGYPVRIRAGGSLQTIRPKPLGGDELRTMLEPVVPSAGWTKLKDGGEVCFSFALRDKARVRCVLFRHAQGLGASLRLFPLPLPELSSLGLPAEFLQSLGEWSQGLVLVVGPTRSGKSTTLASLAQELARSASRHIVTLEKPIEWIVAPGKSIVSQREIPADVPSFALGLRELAYEDADVAIVGSLDQADSIVPAFRLAEQGVFVVGALCTIAQPLAILQRLMALFGERTRDQIRSLLSRQLRAILGQRLLPQSDGRGWVLLAEVVVFDETARALLGEARFEELARWLKENRRDSSPSLRLSLEELATKGKIGLGEAKTELVLLERSEQWL